MHKTISFCDFEPPLEVVARRVSPTRDERASSWVARCRADGWDQAWFQTVQVSRPTECELARVGARFCVAALKRGLPGTSTRHTLVELGSSLTPVVVSTTDLSIAFDLLALARPTVVDRRGRLSALREAEAE